MLDTNSDLIAKIVGDVAEHSPKESALDALSKNIELLAEAILLVNETIQKMRAA